MLMKTTTGYIKSPYNMGDCFVLENYLSVYNPDNDQYIPYGFIVHDNALYIPNIDIERFMKPLGETEVINLKPNEWRPMSRHYMSKFEPRDTMQENVISFITGERTFKSNQKEHQIGIVLKTGGGKALPMDATLPTPRGIIRMKDVQIGTELFSKDGKPTKVTEIYPQGVKDIYEVTFDDGRVAECTSDHLWEVFYIDPSRGIIDDVLPLKEIKKQMDEVGCKYLIPTTDPVQYKKHDVPIPDIYGAILASHIDSLRCTINTSPEIAEKIAFLTNTHAFYDTSHSGFVFHKPITGFVSWKWILKKLHIKMSSDINNRFIDSIYLYSDQSKLFELSDGILSGFDRIALRMLESTGVKVVYLGPSLSIAKSIAYAFRSKGVAPRYKKVNDCYEIALHSGDPQESLGIKSIEYIGKKDSQCIKVDHPSHTFLAYDFIVTHNTFTSIYSLTNLNRKALIVTHMTKIEDQWVKTMLEMFDYQGDKIMRLSTKDMDKILSGEDPDMDVYFVNHQILNRWLSTNSPTKLNDVFKNLGIGIKIIDEYHLHWRNSIILDLFTNIDKTIYLTATFGRSNPEEAQLFRKVTEKIVTYGSSDNSVDDKHTEYHPVIYTSKCPFKTARAMASGHGMGMRKWVYADWQHINNPENHANKIILSLLEKCLSSEGKILITVASIKCCDIVADFIRKQYPDESIGVINSSYSPKDNEYTKEKCRIIVSTIQSAGTGVDIKKLRYIINSEPFSSKITAEQFLGRLRPYFDDNGEQRTTYLFDLVDRSIMHCNIYYKARSKRISQLAKETQPIEI